MNVPDDKTRVQRDKGPISSMVYRTDHASVFKVSSAAERLWAVGHAPDAELSRALVSMHYFYEFGYLPNTDSDIGVIVIRLAEVVSRGVALEDDGLRFLSDELRLTESSFRPIDIPVTASPTPGSLVAIRFTSEGPGGVPPFNWWRDVASFVFTLQFGG